MPTYRPAAFHRQQMESLFQGNDQILLNILYSTGMLIVILSSFLIVLQVRMKTFNQGLQGRITHDRPQPFSDPSLVSLRS